MKYAHRIVREIVYGPIPPGLEVMHECDNKGCANPVHLSVGSRKQNMVQARERGLLGRGETHHNTHLTTEAVLEIRKLYKAGVPQRDIATRYGISSHSVREISVGRRWSHIKVNLAATAHIGGERVRGPKLTIETVRTIKKRLQGGVYQRIIAKDVGVCQSMISMIHCRKSWAHV